MGAIDFHVHAFPFSAERYLPGKSRDIGRFWAKTASHAMHAAQPWIRHLPPALRRGVDEVTSLLPAPFLLLESSIEDLLAAMERSGVEKSVLIGHPGMIPNEWVLEQAKLHPELIPAVNVAPGTPDSRGKLAEYARDGARLLKIHPAADGLGPDSSHYLELIQGARELALPVILHTGCLHSHAMYKDPEASDARRFEPWFAEFPELTFVLAHMNFHEPETAMDLAERYPNVLMDTSWQPIESITEAVRRVGSDQVLFGSDWPLLGENMEIGLNRIRAAVRSQFISEDDAEKIVRTNALRVLGEKA